MRSKAYLLWLSLWLLFQACTTEVDVVPATQVVVRIDADAEVRAHLAALRVRVAGERSGEWAPRSDARFARSDLMWPVDIVVAPQKESDAGSYFEVIVEALGDDEDVLVQARALTTFVLRETRILTLQLERCGTNPLGYVCESDAECYGPTCRTCVDARCDRTPVIEPDGLAPFSPPMPSDGGTVLPGSDAGGSGGEGRRRRDAEPRHGRAGPARCRARRRRGSGGLRRRLRA